MTGDLISREALKKCLQEHKDLFIKAYGGRHNFITNAPQDIKVRVDELNNCIAEVVNAPTIEPFEPDYVGAERVKARQRGYEEGYNNGLKLGKTLNPKIKQGEWIKYSFKDFGALGDYDYKCSNCEKVSGSKYNFCSNCGADMRGGLKNDRE